jgi:hypothetical protein
MRGSIGTSASVWMNLLPRLMLPMDVGSWFIPKSANALESRSARV